MTTATPCPDCGEPLGGRYSHRGLVVCWPCWMKRTGLGRTPTHRGAGVPKDQAVTTATAALIRRLTDALGPPVSTPDLVRGDAGQLERSRYRLHRWRCPACRAHWDDRIYRPLVVDSDGRVYCDASKCSAEAIAAAVRELLAANRSRAAA
jgi:ribosomal protein L37AE/L43A